MTKNIKTYNGYKLDYIGELTSYNSEGKPIGKAKIGRDSDNRLCVEDGKYTGGQYINGEVHYFYHRHKDVINIRKGDLTKLRNKTME